MPVSSATDVTEYGLLEIESCHYCGSKGLTFFKSVYSTPSLAVEFCDGYIPMITVANYVICPKCGLLMLSPRMTDERIDKFYESGEYRRTLGLRKELVVYTENERADSLLGFLIKHNIELKSHLDMGSGNGFFVEKTKHHYGSYSVGYDPGDIKDLPKGTFDLVSSSHCLEHCIYPTKELEFYRSKCKGYLLLEVPGYVDMESSDYHGLRFSHLYCFPVNVLLKMVENAGFKVLVLEKEPETRLLAEVV